MWGGAPCTSYFVARTSSWFCSEMTGALQRSYSTCVPMTQTREHCRTSDICCTLWLNLRMSASLGRCLASTTHGACFTCPRCRARKHSGHILRFRGDIQACAEILEQLPMVSAHLDAKLKKQFLVFDLETGIRRPRSAAGKSVEQKRRSGLLQSPPPRPKRSVKNLSFRENRSPATARCRSLRGLLTSQENLPASRDTLRLP